MTRNCLEIKLKAPQSAVDEQLHTVRSNRYGT
jgi:hypothetical protein